MAAKSDLVAGTITLTNGSTAVVGTGTSFLLSLVAEGDELLQLVHEVEGQTPWEAMFASVEDNTHGTLLLPWAGPTGTFEYRLRFQPDGSRVGAQARNLVELIGNGTLLSVAGLSGPGVIELLAGGGARVVPKSDLIAGVDYDVTVNTLPDRAAYDAMPGPTADRRGYSVIVASTGSLYSKLSDASGDWSDAVLLTGPGITLDVTEVDEVPYGTPPDVTLTAVAGGYQLGFEIPRGMIIEPGETTTLAPDQQAAVTFVPIAGGYRLDIAIPRGPTGDIDGVTPFWVSRLGADADAIEALNGLGAVSKSGDSISGILTVADLRIGQDSATPQAVFVGDSLMMGALASAPPSDYVDVPSFNGIAFAKSNIAVSGRTLLEIYEKAFDNLNPLFAQAAGINIAVIWGGTNDIGTGATPQVAYSRLKRLSEHLRSLGWKVIVATMISRVGLDTQKNNFNALIRANYQSFADGIADMSWQPIGLDGAYANTAFFNADQVHLTDAGYEQAGFVLEYACGLLIPFSGAPGASAYLPNSTANNLTGDGTTYRLSGLTEQFDQRSNFNGETFTCLSEGTYTISVNACLANVDATHSIGLLYVVTTEKTYTIEVTSPAAKRASNGLCSLCGSISIRLRMFDTVNFDVLIVGGSKTVGLYADNGATTVSVVKVG